MSVGGIIQRANKKEPGPAGPPGVVANANNGTSLDTATSAIVQLGQDVGAVGNPATLLSNRDIPFNGKVLQFLSGTHPFARFDGDGTTLIGDYDVAINNGLSFYISPLLQQTNIGDASGLYLDIAPGGYSFGDINGAFGSGVLQIQSGIDLLELGDPSGASAGIEFLIENLIGTGERAAIRKSAFNHFLINFLTTEYELGDINSTGNSTRLYMQDSNMVAAINGRDVQIGDYDSAFNGTKLSIADNTQLVRIESNTKGYLIIDVPNDAYIFGDADSAASGGLLDIEGATQELFLYPAAGAPRMRLYINNATSSILLGTDSSGGNDTHFYIDDVGQTMNFFANGKFDFQNAVGQSFLTIEPGPASVLIGDIDGKANSTIISIADSTNAIAMGQPSGNGYLELIMTAAAESLAWYIQGNQKIYSDANFTGIGDISGAGSSTKIGADDTAQQCTIDASNGLKITGDTTLLHTGTALANGAGALVGTLNNSPAAGNPTKWIPIDDNGTTRYVPAW